MTPEARARQTIDRQLAEAGWQVQDVRSANLSAADGVAVCDSETRHPACPCREPAEPRN